MRDDLTHASFFSGVGGLDMGLERGGWRTVSFSEIDPYASAVLAQRWPGVPNLGDITELASEFGTPRSVVSSWGRFGPARGADLWTGGFPCQDLSIAGKRRGMVEGTRSNLAYAFLALAERHRPRYVLLENVPGLLSSHGGRDMAALLGALVELGYGVGYRVLDARYFGVPQRRRRVFILGVSPGGRAGAELAAEVLSVGSRCRRHPPTGIEAGEGVAGPLGEGAYGTGRRDEDDPNLVGPHVTDDARGQGRGRQGAAGLRGHEPDDGHQPDADPVRRAERPSSDPGRVRASDGLAGRSYDRGGVAATLNSGGNDGGFRTEPGEHLVTSFAQNQRGELRTSDTAFQLTTGGGKPGGRYPAVYGASGVTADDPLLPLGLDSHRYRCCGNGVVSDVAEWIGRRLAEVT